MSVRAIGLIRSAYERLLAYHGPQHWWPADTDFEMMVGAVLVQNTAWTNVERAIASLRAAGLLAPAALASVSEAELAEAIRPAGTFRVKARRLAALVRWYTEAGGHAELANLGTATLRDELLSVHGVGRETCDAILCYAFGRPVFVVDGYARRLYRRLGLSHGDETDERIRSATERALASDAVLLGEWHALVVEHGKRVCRSRPRCGQCVLQRGCPRAGVADQAR